MHSLWLIVVGLVQIKACSNQFHLNPSEEEKIQTKTLPFKDCARIPFESSEKLNSHLGSIKLAARLDNNTQRYLLNVTLIDIKWKKAYLKLSQENNEESICKMYAVGNEAHFPIAKASDACFNLNYYNTSVNYVLELKAELNTDILYKKLIFKFPHLETFVNTTPLAKRSLFTYIDRSSNYGLVLKIQNLPKTYNVNYYKVEVFKEKEQGNILLDVRMLNSIEDDELSFEYITYNEEGYYFFKISVVSDECPEDFCFKTSSPIIYIKRKYPPLVIGIVGASFLIPFILFIFHMWTRRSQSQVENEEEKDAIFLVYNQTPEQHYLIVKALEKSLKNLGKVRVVTKISEASHILYVCGTHIFDPDPLTHKHLVIEANKAISNVDILVLRFPYSTKEVPPYLRKCSRFDMMEDFSKFIHLFNCEAEFENDPDFLDLESKVGNAHSQTEPKKIILNVPVIIVTEQSDNEAEPKESDVLL